MSACGSSKRLSGNWNRAASRPEESSRCSAFKSAIWNRERAPLEMLESCAIQLDKLVNDQRDNADLVEALARLKSDLNSGQMQLKHFQSEIQTSTRSMFRSNRRMTRSISNMLSCMRSNRKPRLPHSI